MNGDQTGKASNRRPGQCAQRSMRSKHAISTRKAHLYTNDSKLRMKDERGAPSDSAAAAFAGFENDSMMADRCSGVTARRAISRSCVYSKQKGSLRSVAQIDAYITARLYGRKTSAQKYTKGAASTTIPANACAHVQGYVDTSGISHPNWTRGTGSESLSSTIRVEGIPSRVKRFTT